MSVNIVYARSPLTCIIRSYNRLVSKPLDPYLPIRATPTAQHTTGAGRVPRPRGTGRLLSNSRGVGLALLRLEHVHGVSTGDLALEVEGGENEKIGVTPWTPDGWPTMPESDSHPGTDLD